MNKKRLGPARLPTDEEYQSAADKIIARMREIKEGKPDKRDIRELRRDTIRLLLDKLNEAGVLLEDGGVDHLKLAEFKEDLDPETQDWVMKCLAGRHTQDELRVIIDE